MDNCMRKLLFSALCALFACIGASPARAELFVGVTTSNQLVTFDGAALGSFSTMFTLSGVAVGQTIRSLDYRPANGVLYGLGIDDGNPTLGQVYTLNVANGAATPIGGALALAGNTSVLASIDFNPVVDALRVVGGQGQNYRVNANTGALIARDTDLALPNSSPGSPLGIAYTNNLAGATQTTLYAFEFSNDSIYTICCVNGSPSPNGGAMQLVGPAGVSALNQVGGFDISGATGIGYINFAPDGVGLDNLYTVNLASGALSLVGNIGDSLRDITVIPGTAAVPEPSAMAFAALGAIGFAVMARRRRAA